MNDVTIHTFDEFYAVLENGWNCAEEYTPKYEAEHEGIHILMKSRLHAFLGGEKNGNFNFEAFTAIEDGWTTSRVVGAWFNTNAFIRPDLVTGLKAIANEFPEDYLMHIISEDFDPEIGDFELAITKTFVLGLFYGDTEDLNKIHANITD